MSHLDYIIPNSETDSKYKLIYNLTQEIDFLDLQVTLHLTENVLQKRSSLTLLRSGSSYTADTPSWIIAVPYERRTSLNVNIMIMQVQPI
jgi:hypothetical protein